MWSANVTVQWEIFKGENFCGFHRSEQGHKKFAHKNLHNIIYIQYSTPQKVYP